MKSRSQAHLQVSSFINVLESPENLYSKMYLLPAHITLATKFTITVTITNSLEDVWNVRFQDKVVASIIAFNRAHFALALSTKQTTSLNFYSQISNYNYIIIPKFKIHVRGLATRYKVLASEKSCRIVLLASILINAIGKCNIITDCATFIYSYTVS